MPRSSALPRAVTPGAPTSARRALLASGATLAVLAGSVLLAGPASAHVTVNPREAAPGGFAKLTFRVATESAKASTTKLSVDFPTATPFVSTVSWNQRSSGSAEPEHPAPTLTLTAAGAGATTAPAGSASAQPASPGTAPVADVRSTDGTARALGTAGLVVGALGLLTGAVGASRRRRA